MQENRNSKIFKFRILYLISFCFILAGCSSYSPLAPDVYPDLLPTVAPSQKLVPDSPKEIPVEVDPNEVSIYNPGKFDGESENLPVLNEITPVPDIDIAIPEVTENVPDLNTEPTETPETQTDTDILTELAKKFSILPGNIDGVPLSPLAQKVFERINDEVTNEANSTVAKEYLTTSDNSFIKPLVDGVEIFTGFKDLISQAKHEVNLVSFEWNPKSDAARVIGEGIKLAEQNYIDKKIIVRIIIDDFDIDPRRIIDAMNTSRKSWNIDESKIDLQFATYPHLAFGASHSKYLVVDGKYVIITGANVQVVHNFTPDIWHDTGYLMEGTVALTILKDFDNSWTKYAHHYNCLERIIPIDCLRTRAPAIPDRSYLLDNYYHSGIPVITLPKRSREKPNDIIDSPTDQGWIAAMDNAEVSINIETPNINATGFQDTVISALKRGVTVKIITNQGYNDLLEKMPFQGGSNIEIFEKLKKRIISEDSSKADFLKMGWYSKDGITPIVGHGKNVSHTKYMSIDGKITIIGSGNMDTQTWTQSREINFLIDSQDATERILRAFYNGDWDRSIKY
jgi:phosphatidylserine/phosphatidylglycerophosphate/cardiolipin synthase-like enzyme